ncbi:uncharacterized protein [Nicotiana sylvestris]|uniref:uncharacterized protein n=1 Tax=Nicotiana sylvestris TaxID=4096 RepID=UPI00388C903F
MSRLQKSIALSTTEAKYMANSEAAKEMIWLKNFLEELAKKQDDCEPFSDSQSAIHLAKNPVFHARLKHIQLRNEVIRKKVGVDLVEDMMQEARLRWFEYVKRRIIEVPVRRYEQLASVGCKRGIGRPKKSWGDIIRRDLAQLELTEDIDLDRRMCRSKIRVESL